MMVKPREYCPNCGLQVSSPFFRCENCAKRRLFKINLTLLNDTRRETLSKPDQWLGTVLEPDVINCGEYEIKNSGNVETKEDSYLRIHELHRKIKGYKSAILKMQSEIDAIYKKL